MRTLVPSKRRVGLAAWLASGSVGLAASALRLVPLVLLRLLALVLGLVALLGLLPLLRLLALLRLVAPLVRLRLLL